MRVLMLVLVGLWLGCGERETPVSPSGKASTDCSLAHILAGTCGDTADPTLDEVPAGYEAPEAEASADSTAGAAGGEGEGADGEEPEEAESYFELFFDSNVSPYEQTLIREVIFDIDRVIESGNESGLQIHFSAPLADGDAWGYAYEVRGTEEFITACSVSLQSVRNADLHDVSSGGNEYQPAELFKRIVYHEVAHCLGFGMGEKWFSLVEGRTIPEFPGVWIPRFTGGATRIEFLSATGFQWDEEAAPLLPLVLNRDWESGEYRADTAHLPYMFNGWFNTLGENQFTRLYAAILKDLGYTVNYGVAVPNRYYVGIRNIFSEEIDFWQNDYAFAGQETLYYPGRLLDFVPDCGPRMYCIRDRAEGERGLWDWGRDVFRNDPSIILENAEWFNGFTAPVRAAKPIVGAAAPHIRCGVGH